MVKDKVDGGMRDILVTPMKVHEIAAGYILSTFPVGLVMSALTLVVCVAYPVATERPLSASGIGMFAVLLIPSSLLGLS